MVWVLPFLVALFANSSASLLQRFIQRDSKLHPLGFAILSGATSTVLVGLIVAVRGFDTRLGLLPVAPFVASLFCWTMANILLMYTLRRVEASQFSIVANTRLIWSLLITVIFLGNTLTHWSLLGTVLILAGAITAVWRNGFNIRDKGLLLNIMTAFFVGAASATEALSLSKGYDVFSYFVLGFGIPAVVLAIAFPVAGKSATAILKTKGVNWRVCLLGILYATASVALLTAFRIKGEFATLLSLGQLQTVLVVLGAILLLHEHQFMHRRIIAMIISALGAVLVVSGGR